MSYNCALWFGELQWLSTEYTFAVKQTVFNIVVDSCKVATEQLHPRQGRSESLWAEGPNWRSGQLCLAHTQTHTHTHSVIVTQAWIIGQYIFHLVLDADSWWVKQWHSFILTLAARRRMERHEGRDMVRKTKGVTEEREGELMKCTRWMWWKDQDT